MAKKPTPETDIQLMPDDHEVLPTAVEARKARVYDPPKITRSDGSSYPFPRVDLDEIEMMASVGMTTKQIAEALHINPSVFGRLLANDPVVQEAVDRGTARGVKMVTDSLFQNALKGNVAAQIFFLKNKGGWADRQELDQRLQVENRMSFEAAVEALKAAGIDPDKV